MSVVSLATGVGSEYGLTLTQPEPSGVQNGTLVLTRQWSRRVADQSQTPKRKGVTSTSYEAAPGTGSQRRAGISVWYPGVSGATSVPGSARWSRMRRFLMLGPGVGGTLSNVFVNAGPAFQTPALPLAS